MEVKSLLFLVISFTVHDYTCYGLETRTFDKSTLVINTENNVTLTVNSDTVSFIAIGDSGGIPIWPYRTLIEGYVASTMKKLATKFNTHFQIGLGDNFYLKGVQDVNDFRFDKTFNEVFDSTPMKNSPWFMILGNHDYYGNAKAQVDYTYSGKSKRWVMPSFNYSVDVLTSNGAQKLVTIMMIDTIKICGNNPFETSGSPAYASAAEEQAGKEYLMAFEQKLAAVAASSVPYILVAGHFPIWSISEHGPTQCLIDKLRPLLHKYGVSAYLSGHDHDLQHLKDTYLNKTVDYIVSGCANFNKYSKDHESDVPPNSSKFYWASKSFLPFFDGGLVLVKASRSVMELVFYNTDEKILYTTTIKPRF